MTSHTSKTTQALCKNVFKDIIAKGEWPSSSSDLNPMDYSVWGFFEAKRTGKRFQSVAALKQALLEIWAPDVILGTNCSARKPK